MPPTLSPRSGFPEAASVTCPLCAGTGAGVRECIPVKDLDYEYQRQLGVTVAEEFPEGLSEVQLLRCPDCSLEFFVPAIAGSSKFYAALGAADRYYSTTRWEFAEALKRLPPEPDLVDVGCGDGFFLSLVGGTRKRGLELNADAVRRARERGLDVRPELLPAQPDESADVLTMFQVLEHIPRPLDLLRHAERVLRPGGHLFVAVPNNESWVGQGPPNPLNAPPHHALRWRAEALQFVPRLVPLELEALLAEPLGPEHLYVYRRSRFIAALARGVGWEVPIYRRTRLASAVRKLANVWTEISVRLPLPMPVQPGSGHSVLAIFRKPAGRS